MRFIHKFGKRTNHAQLEFTSRSLQTACRQMMQDFDIQPLNVLSVLPMWLSAKNIKRLDVKRLRQMAAMSL